MFRSFLAGNFATYFEVFHGQASTATLWHLKGTEIVVAVAYLETAPAQPTQANLQHLKERGAVLRMLGKPCLLVGGFNMPHQAVQSNCWAQQLHAHTFACDSHLHSRLW